MKIAILLSTYNSERFIVEQLDSLLRQTVPDIEIHIRDDGSFDRTLEILKQYQIANASIFVHENDGDNLRSAGSFLHLMKLVEADFYLFCDHDDVWLENKVEVSLSAAKLMNKVNDGKPLLVATDLVVVNEDLMVISESFAGYSRIKVEYISSFSALAATNYVTGCTTLFNRALRDRALSYSAAGISMHDHWLGLVALDAGGTIKYIPVPTVLYRQHGSNVVGAKAIRFPLSLLYLPTSLKVLRSYIIQAKTVRPGVTAVAIIWAKFLYRLKCFLFR